LLTKSITETDQLKIHRKHPKAWKC